MRKTLFRAWIFLVFSGWVGAVQGQDFGWVGARAAAMGGAATALADDSTAAHFNPAALAFREGPDSIFTAGGGAQDRRKLLVAIDDFSSIDRSLLADGDPVATAAALDALDRMSESDSGLDGRLYAGVYLSQGGAALSVADLGWVGARPVVDHVRVLPGDDPELGIANNQTRIRIEGLEVQEGAFTYSYSIIPALLAVGVNLKYVRGATYETSPLAFDLDDNSRENVLRDGLDENDATTNRFAWDAGVMLVPTESIRIGACARYLNQPRFARKLGGEVRLERQLRLGVALSLDGFRRTALAVDLDLAPSEAPLADREAQRAAIGAEVLLGNIWLRGGARTDFEDPDEVIVPTAGFGFGAERVRLDVAAAWLADRDAEVSATLRWTLPN